MVWLWFFTVAMRENRQRCLEESRAETEVMARAKDAGEKKEMVPGE